MNYYIDAQIKNMQSITKTFVDACILAAKQGDGIITKDEEKALKQIKAATERFNKDLEKVTR